MTFGDVMNLVRGERLRQEIIRAGDPRASDPTLDWPLKLAALVEEVGEVARSLKDGEPAERLRSELVQVAAVAVAWLESMAP